MDEGFILSNKFRKAVFHELAAGESDIELIAKKHHIIPKVAKSIVEELIKGNVVEKKERRYVLTKEGEKLAAKLKIQEKIGV
jgi:predicted transcriptional regulator